MTKTAWAVLWLYISPDVLCLCFFPALNLPSILTPSASYVDIAPFELFIFLTRFPSLLCFCPISRINYSSIKNFKIHSQPASCLLSSSGRSLILSAAWSQPFFSPTLQAGPCTTTFKPDVLSQSLLPIQSSIRCTTIAISP